MLRTTAPYRAHPPGNSFQVEERNGRVVKLIVRHSGTVSNLLHRFPAAVVRRAADALDFCRTSREGALLNAAKRLDRTSTEIVYQHVLAARCQRLVEAIRAKEVRRVKLAQLVDKVGGHRLAATTALSPTEHFARAQGLEPCKPSPQLDHSRTL